MHYEVSNSLQFYKLAPIDWILLSVFLINLYPLLESNWSHPIELFNFKDIPKDEEIKQLWHFLCGEKGELIVNDM